MSTPIGSSQWMYASGEAVTQQSLKFNDDESQYLSWTPAAAGNRKTWTFSCWLKGAYFAGSGTIFSTSQNYDSIRYTSTGQFMLLLGNGSANLTTTAVFRDPSAWYSLVISVDTTQSTSTNRVKFYVNGSQITSFSTATYPALNYDTGFNHTSYSNAIGRRQSTSNLYYDGYLSDINFIDGQALDATSFGQFTNGYWEAKDYAGTYGTNGFRLTFQDDVVSEGFNTVTYRGTGVTNSVSGLGFSPDLVWIKGRNIAYNHRIYDTVRGVNKRLYSDLTNGEYTSTQSVMSFDADGFTLGTDAGENNGTTPGSFVAWCWDAGSGSAASNTDGSITSTVKANPDYGFSVVSWTGNATSGATVGHGLSSTPEMIINKNRIDNAGWGVYHSALGATKYIWLQETAAAATYSAAWNDTSPTSSVFTVGNDGQFNGSSDGMISYCFNSVAGYSKISSYTGTGATGNSVTTGFRPAFLLYKRTDAGGNDWVIMDTTRSPSNPVEKRLFPNLSDAESASAGGGIDVTDTGFVINNTYANANASGGTYIYMAFADTREAAFWKDVSGQGNHWTPNNLDYRDSLIDSPANNFATLNPLIPTSSTTAEGNLKANLVPTNTSISSTFAVNSGKWYAEFMPTTIAGYALIGISAPSDTTWQGNTIVLQSHTGNLLDYGDWVASSSTLSTTYTVNDVIGVAVDLDGSTIEYFKNGSSIGSATIALGTTNTDVSFMLGMSSASATGHTYANFGQDSTFAGATTAGGNQDDNGVGDFKYAPPSGYLALCTANLPTPTIVDGSEYFNTVLWTGDGTSSRSFTGYNFAPDFLWAKQRSQAIGHALYDSVRGAGANSELSSNSTAAEGGGNNDQFGYLSSFDSDGFTAVDGTSSPNYYFNENGQSFVGWGWKAGGTAVSNTDGSITSQVSANVDAGFSIVGYTGTGSAGATVGHGLGVTPDLLIMRRRSPAEAWPVWVGGAGFSNTQYLRLNGTNAVDTATSLFNSTTPTSSVVTLGNGNFVNTSANNYIMYAFASVEGFSKFGSYTGNGSTDGSFVYTGFRPAWVMFKRTDAANNWQIYDAIREPFNVTNDIIFADTSGAEVINSTNNNFDILSNGFKLRNTSGAQNASGGTYIYLAFAENPFKYANAR